jgi:autotransporter-associated beta strand protein
MKILSGFLGISLFCLQTNLLAVDSTWEGDTGSPPSLTDAANWSAGVPDGIATFPQGLTGPALTPNMTGGSFSVTNMNFTNTTNPYTLTVSSPLTFSPGTISSNASAPPVFNLTGIPVFILDSNPTATFNFTNNKLVGNEFHIDGALTNVSISLTNSDMLIDSPSTIKTLTTDASSYIDAASNALTIDSSTTDSTVANSWESGSNLTKKGTSKLTCNNALPVTLFQNGTISTNVDLGTELITFQNTPIEMELTTSSSVTLNNPITLEVNGTFNTTNANGTTTLAGLIDNVGRLIKTGPGTLILTETNTYSGGTTVSEGVLEGTTDSLKRNITNNAIVRFNLSANGTYGTLAEIMSGTGSLEKTGIATLTLSTNNTYSGGTTISAGAISIDNLSRLGSPLPGNGLTFDTLTTGTLISTAANMTFTQPVTLENGTGAFQTDNLLTISSDIDGIGNFKKAGSGTLTLSGTNTYTGSTIISGGTLSTSNMGSSTALVFDTAGGILALSNPSQLTFAHPVTLTAAGTINTSDAEVIISGAIGGAQSLTKIGNGILALTGSNNYSGGTTVTAGVLTGTTSGIQGDITNNATVTFNQSTNGTYAGDITGTGALSKTGSGTVIITGTNNYSGGTTITEGTLAVNGSIAGDMTMNGGRLQGIGQVGTDLTTSLTVTNGTVAPGNSIGTLNILGDYNPSANAILEVEINEVGDSDLLHITGEANLAGTVNVLPLGGYKTDNLYTILYAEQGVNGTFNSLNLSPLFQLVYQSPFVYLIAQTTRFTLIAETANQKAVAEQFDNLTEFPFNLALITEALIALPVDQQLQALTEMSGEQYNNLIYLAQDSSSRFLKKIYYPIIQRVKNDCLPTCGDYINVWMDMEGGKTRQHGDVNAHGYKSKDWDLALGIHKCINDYTTLGLALSYEHDHVKFGLNGKGDIKTFLASLYGAYHNDKMYWISELAGGYSHDKVERFINIGDLDFRCTSKPKVAQFLFNNEIGLNFNYQCFGIKPFAAVEYGYYHRSLIKEENGHPLDLQIDTKHKNTCRGFLGLHLANVFHNQLTIGMDISWENRFNYSKDLIQAQFIDFGNRFTIESYKKYDDIGHLSFDISEQFTDNFAAYIILSGEKGKHYHAWDALGGISMKW